MRPPLATSETKQSTPVTIEDVMCLRLLYPAAGTKNSESNHNENIKQIEENQVKGGGEK
jgi:hypothetical protein